MDIKIVDGEVKYTLLNRERKSLKNALDFARNLEGGVPTDLEPKRMEMAIAVKEFLVAVDGLTPVNPVPTPPDGSVEKVTSGMGAPPPETEEAL